MARILGQWQVRRSIPAIRYEFRWTTVDPRLEPGDPRPDENGGLPGMGLLLLDPANRRLRADHDFPVFVGGRLRKVRDSIRYDGQKQFTFMVFDSSGDAAQTEAEVREVNIAPWDRASMRWPADYSPCLWAHGLPWTESELGARVFPFDWNDQPNRFAVEGTGEIDGRECLIVRDRSISGDRQERLWVDAGRGGAIVRRTNVHTDGEISETTLTYQETAQGWLPSRWTRTSRKPGEQPRLDRRVRIERLVLSPPTSVDDFRVALRPGMEVSRPENLYKVGDDGTLIPVYGDENPGEGGVVGPIWDWLARLGWVGVGGIVLAAVLLGGLTWYRWRRRQSSPHRVDGH
jgi:hypothetical protein